MTDQPSGEVILYRRDDGSPAVEVQVDGETVWLSQQQIAELFQTSGTNIVEHICNVYDEGELDQDATCRNFRQVRDEGGRQITRQLLFYNLDLIISVGYRVKSRIATQFRIWATDRLREYLVKGVAMDDAKLKQLGGGLYWRELLGRIRDIRSSEKVLYQQVLDLYAISVDYDPRAEETIRFLVPRPEPPANLHDRLAHTPWRADTATGAPMLKRHQTWDASVRQHHQLQGRPGRQTAQPRHRTGSSPADTKTPPPPQVRVPNTAAKPAKPSPIPRT